MVVSRDRLGIKQLYIWYHRDKLIALCSEIKQFMKLDIFKPSLNRHFAKNYINSGYEKNNESFYKEIIQIDPGTWVEIDCKSKYY